MMAVWVTSGALLLVMLTGASYSYPVKGFDPSSTYSSGYGVNPASTGSNWEVASSGFASAAPGAGSKSVSNPARPYTATPKQPGYLQPSLPREPAVASSSSTFAAPVYSGYASSAPYTAAPREPSYPQPSLPLDAAVASSSSTFAAPVYSGYASSSPAGSSSSQPTFNKDFPWTVAPPSPFSSEETPRRPSSHRFASTEVDPEPLGPSNVSPPIPQYQAGELSHLEEIYEQGDYESLTEEQGLQPPRPVARNVDGVSTSEFGPSGLGRGGPGYPYDYMFLTGQYPPGKVTHYSVSFEQGRDSWQDSGYKRAHVPASTWEVDTLPAAPQHVKQPTYPVEQSAGHTSYGQSGAAVGYNQPSVAADPRGPYTEQPRWLSPAGGYGKGGY